MEGGTQCNPRTVEEVSNDFSARRTALIKALTTDKGNLCLVGLPSGNWEVSVAAEQVPTDLPEPALGINFARDKRDEEQWVALVSVRSDAWLFSVAHYFGAKVGFNPSDRILLFDKINALPTVFETVHAIRTEQRKKMKNTSSSDNGSNNSKPSSEGKQQSEPELKKRKRVDDADDKVLCGVCRQKYSSSDLFWMKCSFCYRWFHGTCVGLLEDIACYIKKFQCARCHEKQSKKLT